MKADGESQVVSRVREAMDAGPRIRAAGALIAIDVAADGSLAIEGEVATVAAKKLALGRAAPLPDVVTIVDRLRVAPQRRLSDEQIRRVRARTASSRTPPASARPRALPLGNRGPLRVGFQRLGSNLIALWSRST